MCGDAAASALERLEIYQRSYFLRLEECLADDYPAVKFDLGEAAFEALCRAYIEAHPSRSPNLNGFGARLSGFAGKCAASRGRSVAELARLEWAIVEVLHARATDGFSASDLARLPHERLADVCFLPSPAVRLLSFEYPVNSYFEAFLDGQNPEVPDRGASTVLVVRNGYRIRRLELQSCQAALLRSLLSSEPLRSALSDIDVDEQAVHAWFGNGLRQAYSAARASMDCRSRVIRSNLKRAEVRSHCARAPRDQRSTDGSDAAAGLGLDGLHVFRTSEARPPHRTIQRDIERNTDKLLDRFASALGPAFGARNGCQATRVG